MDHLFREGYTLPSLNIQTNERAQPLYFFLTKARGTRLAT